MLYGVAFADVPWQFLILLPGVYLLGLETIQVQHFTGVGLPKAIPVFWVAVTLLNIVLNLVLVPRFGGYGAAVSSSVAYAAIFLMVAAYFHRRTGRSVTEAFMLQKGELSDLLRLFAGRPVSSEASA
jgi:O-antigen/teichoic acid export membrane protein